MNDTQITNAKSDFRQFTYILDKIKSSNFREEPFKHLEIFDFLSEEHFNSLVTADQISIPAADSPSNLINDLLSKGYEPIPFPGCTTSVADYLNWLQGKSIHSNHEICEGFGIAFRLKYPQDSLLVDINNFFKSDLFKKTLEDKFGIIQPTTIDTGLQKYLHGYEISPHPDIRKKALTYMLNVNPYSSSEDLEIHTHYLTFKPQKRFVGEFWRYNEDFDTCWVPWEWCNTVKQQRQNNSMVIFSPSWDTLHAIKLDYDHLKTQRTQFYGNLWYAETPLLPKPQYDQFDLQPGPEPVQSIPQPVVKNHNSGLKSYVKKIVPPTVKKLVKRFTH